MDVKLCAILKHEPKSYGNMSTAMETRSRWRFLLGNFSFLDCCFWGRFLNDWRVPGGWKTTLPPLLPFFPLPPLLPFFDALFFILGGIFLILACFFPPLNLLGKMIAGADVGKGATETTPLGERLTC